MSYYKNGQRMPPLEFMEALVRDARTHGGLSAEAAREAFCAYRTALVQLGTPGGSDQNSLLLRVYDLTQELSALAGRLEAVRASEAQARSEREKLQQSAGEQNAVETGRQRELQERGEQLAQLRTGLVEQRATLTVELKECQSRSLELRRRQDVEDCSPGVRAPQVPGGVDPYHPAKRSRAVHLVMVAAVTGALAAAGIVLIVLMVRPSILKDGSEDKPTPSVSHPATPTPAPSSPKASPSKTDKPTPSTSKTRKPSTRPSSPSPSSARLPPDVIGGGTSSAGADGSTSTGNVGGGQDNDDGIFGGTSSDPSPSTSPSPGDSGGFFGGPSS
ncbi:hypothetical protein AB0I10_39370 [Streptomyces sp. NPDC050636]|uniref:hypothetical protein n=1 Tax=Streptomyces sp. NPDC050636 TaxID=3154510 RepID=UPI003412890A